MLIPASSTFDEAAVSTSRCTEAEGKASYGLLLAGDQRVSSGPQSSVAAADGPETRPPANSDSARRLNVSVEQSLSLIKDWIANMQWKDHPCPPSQVCLDE